MTIVSDPDFEIEGPDEDPTEIVNHQTNKADKARHNSKAKASNKAKAGDKAKPEDKSKPEDNAKPDSKTEPEAEADLDETVDTDDSADAELEDEAGVEVDLDDDPEVEVEAEVEGEVEAELEDETAPEAEADTGAAPAEDDDAVAEPTPEIAAVIEPERASKPDPTPAVVSAADGTGPDRPWTTRQLMSVAQRALLVFAVMGMVGYGLGAVRGSSHIARTEFVYTLDESVPDSFLREDRRLLTQVVTFKSDAVLTPVAERFDLSVDELRTKIDIETLELSEVLRLDVSDADADRAVALSGEVLDQYLRVITDATPADESEELAQRRVDVTSQLSEADAARRALLEAGQRDAVLEVRQGSIQRQIDLKNDQIGRIQQSLDEASLQAGTTTRVANINEQLQAAQADLVDLESELATVGSERAELATETTAEPALLREIERLEAKLTTIDDELSERELAPLVASPIRELSQPIVLFRSMHLFGLQGMALGLMAGIPIAAFVAYRARRRQLWFD